MVGYHLGGGLPLLGRTFGYAADRVRALDVVTADGEARTLTPDDDLFRAMLGCRGAFGVVTSLVTEALPLASVTGGGLWFTGDAIEPAVRACLRWTAGVPETVNSSVPLIRLPDLPVIPEPIRGRRIAHVRVAVVGGDVDLAPLRAAAPVLDTVAELPVDRLSSIHDEPSGPVVFKARNALLGGLDDAAATVLLDHAESGEFLVEIRHLGGALADGRALVGRRDAEYVVYTGSALPDASAQEAAAAAQARLHDALAPWRIGTVTPAFLTGTHGLDAAFTADEQARLSRVKRAWDPDDLFRVAPFRPWPR